jgi:hypothetical protein
LREQIDSVDWTRVALADTTPVEVRQLIFVFTAMRVLLQRIAAKAF